MTAFLVHSRSDDVHADAVLWALGEFSCTAFFWPSGEFPARQGWSAEILAENGVRQWLEIGGEPRELPAARVVWNRRGRAPAVSETLDPQDAEHAAQESRVHMRSLMRLVSPAAMWVNPPGAVEADSYKPLQLRTAMEVGLRVPATLFSNEPDAIDKFWRRHKGQVVYKGYRTKAWNLPDHPDRFYAVNRTVPVTAEDLEQREALSAAPGIFQRRIEKAFELRVTAMGRTLIAARIDSQAHEATREDRRSGQHLAEISPFELPDAIAEKCRRYMRAAGLRFGCFDFIVTPEGEYVFLEVNQAGQFLWKELRCPELPMLQAFCDFLIAADPDFLWQPREPELTFADYLSSDAGRAFEARTDPTESAKRRQAPA